MKINKDLTAAGAIPLLLMILGHGESYGYEIIKTVNSFSNGEWEWTEGMLYPILHRLEQQKMTESFWKEAPTGRKRKYYRITSNGTSALKDLQMQWSVVQNTLENCIRQGNEDE